MVTLDPFDSTGLSVTMSVWDYNDCNTNLMHTYPITNFVTVSETSVTCNSGCPFYVAGTCHSISLTINPSISDFAGVMGSGKAQLSIVSNVAHHFGIWAMEVYDGVTNVAIPIATTDILLTPCTVSPVPTIAFNLQSCTMSESPTPSMSSSASLQHFPFGSADECSSPFKIIRFNDTDYLAANPLTPFLYDLYDTNVAALAGTNNCNEFDRIWNVNYPDFLFIGGVYIDIRQPSAGVHTLLGVTTTDPLFNVTITYATPNASTILREMVEGYTFTPFGINPVQADSTGFIEPQCTNTVYYLNNGDFPPENFELLVAMSCTVVETAVFDAGTCDDLCYDADSGTYECFTATINCVQPFLTPYNHTYAMIELINLDIGNQGTVAMIAFSVSDGADFVPVDLVSPVSESDYGACDDVFKLDVVNITEPCCSADYRSFPYALNDGSLLTDTPFPLSCPYFRQLQPTHSGYTNQLGIAIEYDADTSYVSSVSLDVFGYLSPEHVDYYLKMADLTGYGWEIWLPTVFFGNQCDKQLSTCGRINDESYDFFKHCEMGTVNIDFNPETENAYQECPLLYGFYNNSVIFPNAPIPGGSYTFNFVITFHDLYDYIELGPNAYLGIAWEHIFPDDRIYFVGIQYSYIDRELLGTHDLEVDGSRFCGNSDAFELPCACNNCDDTNTNAIDRDFKYVASPFLFDDGLIVGPLNGKTIEARRIEVAAEEVSANLRAFIRGSQEIHGNTVTYSPDPNDDAVPTKLMADNNCGVFINIEDCSHNVQVWLSPTNASIADPDEFTDYLSFDCNILFEASQRTPFPLTDNVFIRNSGDWNFLPDPPTPSAYPLIPQAMAAMTFYSSFKEDDPEMKFSQGVYGFEVQRQIDGLLGGLYFFCNINTYPGNGSPLQALFEGKNLCMASDPDAAASPLFNPLYPNLGVSNASLFDTSRDDGGEMLLNFHFMLSGQCPDYTMCPSDGWFVNQDYAIDTDYVGRKMQFPAADYNYANTSIFPYEVDVTFKLRDTGIVLDQYNASTDDLIYFVLGFAGPIQQVNIMDFDLFLADSGCNERFCNDITINSTYNLNDEPSIIFNYGQHVLGNGIKLSYLYKPELTNIDHSAAPFILNACYASILERGYSLDDMSIKLRVQFDVDYDTLFDQNFVDDVDYQASPSFSDRHDGLAKRFYLTGAVLAIVTPDLTISLENLGKSTSRSMVFRPVDSCARRPYTPQNYCNGVCDYMSRRQIIGARDAVSAKGESHPNSTFYDDLGLNSTYINDFLGNLFLPYNDSDVIHEQYEYYDYELYEPPDFDDELADWGLCNFYTQTVARDIAANGTGYAVRLNVTTSGYIPEVVEFLVMATFDTELLVSALNDFGFSIAPPFHPGVFVSYDNTTEEVHIFGSAIGIAVQLYKNGTAFYDDGCPDTDVCQTSPALFLVFFDVIVPNATRDTLNVDADVISHEHMFMSGPYFSAGDYTGEGLPYCPISMAGTCGPQEAFGVKVVNMCGIANRVIDPLGVYAPDISDLLNEFNSRNLHDTHVDHIPYHELKGSDPEITFRMGDGIDDRGILGALPIVTSVYAIAHARIAYQPLIFTNGNNVLGNATTGVERYRFALYPCFTDCPNNATHRVLNHPYFNLRSANSSVATDADMLNLTPNGQTSTFFVNTDPDNYIDPVTHNFRGGLWMAYHVGDGLARRAESPNSGNFLLVVNFDHDASVDIINSGGVTEQDVKDNLYSYFGTSEPDVGVYLNLRGSLGAMNMFGLATGTLYRMDPDSHLYRPRAVYGIAFGMRPDNPDINFFPVKRVEDDNDLYVDVCDPASYEAFDFNSCLKTGQIHRLQLNPTTPLSETDGEYDFNFADFESFVFRLGDLYGGVGYGGVDPGIVSGWGDFLPTQAMNGHSELVLTDNTGAFEFVCEECWQAFEDSDYFSWTDSCETFDICGVNLTYYEEGAVVPIEPNPYDAGDCAALNLTGYAAQNTSMFIKWMDQALTPSYNVIFNITVYAEKVCNLTYRIQLAPDTSVITSATQPVYLTATDAFDGDILNLHLDADQLGCGLLITRITLKYPQPVNCVEQTQSFTPSPSPTPLPNRDICCERIYPFETFATGGFEFISQSYTQSRSPSLSLSPYPQTETPTNTFSDSPTPTDTPGITESPSMSVSESMSISESHASTSQSPAWPMVTIDVCTPLYAPKMIMPGMLYQVRDEFVAAGSAFTYDYQRMGLRLGALWLTFSDPEASVHLDYKPGQHHVTLYGYAIGRFSLPPNRVNILVSEEPELFERGVYYFEMNYTVGLLHTGGLTRKPFGPGGVPFVVQEGGAIDKSTVNKGFIRKVDHPSFYTEIVARDMRQDIYLSALNPIISSFGNVQAMILSGMSTGLGENGWFGIGEIAAPSCVELPPSTQSQTTTFEQTDSPSMSQSQSESLSDSDRPNSNPIEHFNRLICALFHEDDARAVGELMFVVEGDCANDCSQSQTPGVYCPIHNVVHSHSMSHSHSQSLSVGVTESQSESVSPSESDSPTMSGEAMHTNQTASMLPVHTPRPSHDDNDLLPWWGILILVLGSLSFLLVIVFFCAMDDRRERSGREKRGEEREPERQPLIVANTSNQLHVQETRPTRMSSPPPFMKLLDKNQ